MPIPPRITGYQGIPQASWHSRSPQVVLLKIDQLREPASTGGHEYHRRRSYYHQMVCPPPSRTTLGASSRIRSTDRKRRGLAEIDVKMEYLYVLTLYRKWAGDELFQYNGSPPTQVLIRRFVSLHADRLQVFEKSILPARQKTI